jgi:3-hydroxyisobutyrate dehydrogenase-like beta-hydroxyacid dehydrogenase
MPENTKPAVGWIGLGDQGLPMAVAIAGAGYPLHVWARHPASLDALGATSHVRHGEVKNLAGACDIVCLCLSADDDVTQVVTSGLLDGMRPGSVVVNHGTGTPGNAVRLTEACAPSGVDVLDAPVSGGRPAAETKALTTLVGGPEAVAERCEPLFRSFSAHVLYLGAAGSGQAVKLFNNALLMMNQASIADIVELAASFAMLDPVTLVDALKLGSASSAALTLLNTMITPGTVDHLAAVEAEDMRIFDRAMTEGGVNADTATGRGLAGANGLPSLIRRLNP